MRDRFVALVTAAPVLQPSTVALASRLAARTNAVLMFLHVVPLQGSDAEGMLHAAVDLSTGAAEAWLRAQAPSLPGVRFRHRLMVGEPEAMVAAFVDAHEVELVVMEEAPRAALSVALWRGLAERLLQRLPCPMVVGGPRFLRADARQALSSAAPAAASPPARVADLLNALVDARADALRGWLDHAADSAARIAASLTVELVARAHDGRPDPHALRRLELELDEHVCALRAVGWRLEGPQRRWGSEGLEVAPSPSRDAFLARVQAHGRAASVPLATADASPRLLVLAAAQVPSASSHTLSLCFDAQEDFLRILGQPGPLPSFETYAFDSEGWMLSNSRFPDHLHAAGLLDTADRQTPLRLRVAEPSEGPVAAWPLTRMARSALAHRDGSDTRGYPDYRGTPVIGAWRWLEEHGFGIVAEVDRAVAFS